MNHDARAASNTRLREVRSDIRHYLTEDGHYHLGIPPVGATIPYADHAEVITFPGDWNLNTAAIGRELQPDHDELDTWRQANPPMTSDERYAATAHRRRRDSVLRRALTWLDQDISPRTPIPRAIIPLAVIAIAILDLGIIVTS